MALLGRVGRVIGAWAGKRLDDPGCWRGMRGSCLGGGWATDYRV